jgi:DHA1 family tetracycline resistance protein-like MFS transporter
MPQLLKTLTGGSMAQMSTIYGAVATVFAAVQLFSSPIQGALSDRYGRRPLLVLSSVGLVLNMIVLALAPSVAWLFLAIAISGLAAGSMSAATAYIADVTAPEQRAARFGYLTAALSTGAAAGFLIGGFAGEVGIRTPFWIGAGLAFVNLLYAFFFLPESLAKEHRAPLKWRSIHPIGAVAGIWRDYPILKPWQCAVLLMNFGATGINSIFVLYVTFRFDWTPRIIGFYATFVMLSGIAIQTGLVSRTIRLLGERRALLGGIGLQILATAACGLAATGSLFVASVFLMLLGGVAEPVRQAINNRIIGASDRGRLSGSERSIISLNGVIAPTLFALMFAGVASGDPHALAVGAPFFVATILMIAGFGTAVWAVNRSPTTPVQP